MGSPWVRGSGFILIICAATLAGITPSISSLSLSGWEEREELKSLSLGAAADSYVTFTAVSLTKDANFGGLSYLKVSSYLGTAPSEESAAYLMFDLSDIPPGAVVHSAVLVVYQLAAFTSLSVADACCLEVYNVADPDWTEYGITGSNVPHETADLSTAHVRILWGREARYAFDVTKDVRASLSSENLALTERLASSLVPLPGEVTFGFASRESDVPEQRPKLTIRYTSTEELNKVSLKEAGKTLLAVTTTSREVTVSEVRPLHEYAIELKEEHEHGWAKITIDKSAFFTNPYVTPGRARCYEDSSYYILVVEYGKSVDRQRISVISHSIGTFDEERRPKRIFDLGEEVYVEGVGFDPTLVIDVYLLPDGGPLESAATIARATVTADEEGYIQSTMIWRANRPGIYDIWADANRNGAFDDQDIINDKNTEAYPMVTVPEFNVAAPLLLAALVFLPSCWSRTHLIKREVAKRGSNAAPFTSDPASNRP